MQVARWNGSAAAAAVVFVSGATCGLVLAGVGAPILARMRNQNDSAAHAEQRPALGGPEDASVRIKGYHVICSEVPSAARGIREGDSFLSVIGPAAVRRPTPLTDVGMRAARLGVPVSALELRTLTERFCNIEDRRVQVLIEMAAIENQAVKERASIDGAAQPELLFYCVVGGEVVTIRAGESARYDALHESLLKLEQEKASAVSDVEQHHRATTVGR